MKKIIDYVYVLVVCYCEDGEELINLRRVFSTDEKATSEMKKYIYKAKEDCEYNKEELSINETKHYFNMHLDGASNDYSVSIYVEKICVE